MSRVFLVAPPWINLLEFNTYRSTEYPRALWPCRGIISTGLSMQFKGRYLSVWFDKNTYPSIPESTIRRLCRFRLLGKRNWDSVLLRNTYTAVGPCRLFPSLESSQSLFVVHFYYVHLRTKIFCKAFTLLSKRKQRGYVRLTTTATAALIIILT